MTHMTPEHFAATAGRLAGGYARPGGIALPGGAPTSRYVLPQFEERTAYGFKRQDPYTKLFEDRIIFSACRWTTPRPTTSWRSCWSWSPRTRTATS